LKKWYLDNDVSKKEISRIVIRVLPYTLYNGHLYKLGLDGVLQQCLFLENAFIILEDFHEWLASGHFGINIVMRIMLLSSY
jgi:hypothetical protein